MNTATEISCDPIVWAGLANVFGKHFFGDPCYTPENTVLTEVMVTVAVVLMLRLAAHNLAERLPGGILTSVLKFFTALLVIEAINKAVWLPLERWVVINFTDNLKGLLRETCGSNDGTCTALRALALVLQDSLVWDTVSPLIAAIPLLASLHACQYIHIPILRSVTRFRLLLYDEEKQPSPICSEIEDNDFLLTDDDFFTSSETNILLQSDTIPHEKTSSNDLLAQ